MASKDETPTTYEAKADLYVGAAAAHRAGGTFVSNPAQIDLMGWNDDVKALGKVDAEPATASTPATKA